MKNILASVLETAGHLDDAHFVGQVDEGGSK